MKSNHKVFLAIAVLALAALSCQAVTGGGDGGDSTDTPRVDVILQDDFSDETWGTGTDTDSSVEYADGVLQMIVFTKNYFVWSTPDANDYENVHMEATINASGTDSTTAFGFMCHQQVDSNSFYYLVVTPAGEYAIAKAATGVQDTFLTNNDQWAKSDAIAKSASSYRVGADCGNGKLSLYVDGQLVDSVTDASYTGGGVALLVWSGEDATNTNVSFDDFLMSKLAQ